MPIPKSKGYESDLASLLEDTSVVKTQDVLEEVARTIRYQSRVIEYLKKELKK